MAAQFAKVNEQTQAIMIKVLIDAKSYTTIPVVIGDQ
jgi:hypothetical protein